MSRIVEGENREQSTLFHERIDEYISDENPIRVVGAFVDELNLFELGFDRFSLSQQDDQLITRQ